MKGRGRSRHQEMEKALANEAKRVQRLELLLQVSQELSSERDFDRLLEKIWDRLTVVMEAERSSLFLIDHERGELWSKIAQKAGEIRFPIGTGISGTVAVTGQLINIAEAYEDPRFNPEFDRKTGFKTRSILAAPMKNIRGEILGVVQVLNKKDGTAFTAEDEELLLALSATAGVAIETVQLYEDQKKAIDAVITGLSAALDARDHHASGHSFLVQAYSVALAEEMGLPQEAVKQIKYSAALHDFGKVGVPDRVLLKDSALDDQERAEYELHALKTRILLENMHLQGELEEIPNIAPYNHKWFGGGGYPDGPPEKERIPLGARIVAVADALHVLMSRRYEHKPLELDEALGRIQQDSGRRFDPAVVQALVKLKPRLEDIRKETEEAYERLRIRFDETC